MSAPYVHAALSAADRNARAGTVPFMSRSPGRRRAVVLLVSGVVLFGGALAATAADHRVTVVDGAFQPSDLTVTVGDTVTFVFEAGGHAARAEAGEDGTRAFDTHPECGPLRLQCSQPGQKRTFTAAEPGLVAYFCPIDRDAGMTGTIEVVAAPSPSPTATTTTPPEPSPTPKPSPSPTPTDSPTESPPTAPSPNAPPPTSAPPQPPPPPPSPPSAAPDDPSPTPSPTLETPLPTFTEPEFEDFPAPVEPTDPDDDVPGEVAVVPGDGGAAERVVWGTVGGAVVLGTIGAIGRVVLFGEPWDLGG